MAYAFIGKHLPATLRDLAREDAEICATLNESGHEGINRVAIPHVVREMITGLHTMGLLKRTEKRQSEQTLPALPADGVQTAIARVRERLLAVARRHGSFLTDAYTESHRFCAEPTFRSPSSPGMPSLANFTTATEELQRTLLFGRQIHDTVRKTAADDVLGHFSSAAENAEGALLSAYDIPAIQRSLTSTRDRFYSDTDVRLALQTREHVTNTNRVKDGAYVLESPTVVNLLNAMHKKVYGRRPRDAMGMALGGPPGLGKTAILSHYVKAAIGVDPISIDIDPGQSSFTLMAKPRLVESDPVSATLQTMEQLKGMSKQMLLGILAAGGKELKDRLGVTAEDVESDDVSTLQDKMSGGLRDLAQRQMAGILATSERRGGYVYGPIYEALEKNVPVILNEVQQLRQAEFLHSLLTAIPATDAEAGPMPSYTPSEGEETTAPPGWFFSTLTARWTRVPHLFRVYLTGNIGADFGNQGLPPALVSRLGDRLHEMPLLPTNEQTDIAWAHTSNRDGLCMLSTEEAVRLHHLLTQVVPEIERLHRQKGTGNQKVYFSIRTIIDIARDLYPEGMAQVSREKKTLEDAIYEQFIKPAITNRFTNSLQIVLAVLLVSGFITQRTMRRVTEALPQIQTGQIEAIKQEMMAAQGADTTREVVSFDMTAKIRESYEDACVVCGLISCPIHSAVITEHVGEIKLQADMLKVGLDRRAVQKLIEFQQKLAANKQWDHLLAWQIENAVEGARLTDILTPAQLTEFQAYLDAIQEKNSKKDPLTPQECYDILKLNAQIKKIGITSAKFDAVTFAATLNRTAATHLVSNKKAQGTPLSNDQKKMFQVLDMANATGYHVELGKFDYLKERTKASLEKSLEDTEEEILGEGDVATKITRITAYIKFLAASARMFKDDAEFKEYISANHINNRLKNLIETAFAAFLLNPRNALQPAALNPRGSGRKKRAMVQPPQALALGNTADQMSLRMKMVEAFFEWKSLMEFVSRNMDDASDLMTEMIKSQNAWMAENKDLILDEGHLGQYFYLVDNLGKIQGVHLMSLIEKVAKPKIVPAPPMREF